MPANRSDSSEFQDSQAAGFPRGAVDSSVPAHTAMSSRPSLLRRAFGLLLLHPMALAAWVICLVLVFIAVDINERAEGARNALTMRAYGLAVSAERALAGRMERLRTMLVRADYATAQGQPAEDVLAYDLSTMSTLVSCVWQIGADGKISFAVGACPEALTEISSAILESGRNTPSILPPRPIEGLDAPIIPIVVVGGEPDAPRYMVAGVTADALISRATQYRDDEHAIALIDDRGNLFAQGGDISGREAQDYLTAPLLHQLIALAKKNAPKPAWLRTDTGEFAIYAVPGSSLDIVAVKAPRRNLIFNLLVDRDFLLKLFPILLLMLMATLIIWRHHATRAFRASLEQRQHIRREAGSRTTIVYSWDMATDQIIIWGDFAQTLGYKPGEIDTTTGRWLDAVVPEDQERVRNAFDQHYTNAEAFEFEFRVNHKDGSTRVWRTNGHPMTLVPGLRATMCGVILDVTDLRRSEQIIRDREEYLNAVTEASVDGMVTIDSEGIICTANSATLRIFGYTRGELIGHHVEMLLPDSYLQPYDRYLQNYAAKDIKNIVGTGREIEGRRADGTTFALELSVTEFILTTGERRFLGTLRDLSDHKAAESAQLRFGRIVESVSNEIYVVDAETFAVSMINNSALSNLGYPAAQAEKLTLLDIMPLFSEKTLKALLLPLKTGERLEIELQTQLGRRNGTKYDVEMTVQYLEQETPPVFVATANDVTERNERTRRLRESEQGLKQLVDELRDHAILTLDAEGTIKSANAGADTVFGYQPNELIGKPISIFHLDEDRRNGQTWHMLEAARLNGRYSNVGRCLRKDRSEIWVDTSLSAIHNATGAVIGFIKITRDVTERRQREERLYQSQKMEAIGQLTGGIAHDFNNLLAVVIGNLALLEERTLDEEVLEMLDAPLQAARRGAELTQRLLAFARRQTLNPEVIDLQKSIAKTALLLKRVLGGNVAVSVEAFSGDCLAIADEAQLESAILNLSLNARDAMPGGGTLAIGARNVDIENESPDIRGDIQPGPYVAISLTDSGAGMPQDVLDHVFEPFFTTKETGRGTGLGLSMVYGFAQQSRGGVTIHSDVGVGTTVCLYLPRAVSLPIKTQGNDAELSNETLNFKVLLVEDDDMVRMSVKRQLQRLGCEVLEANSGTVGLDYVQKNQPLDLVLSDIVMPGGINGLELARRCQIERPDVKILLMTGYSDPAAAVGDGSISKFLIVSKPFDRKELRRAILEVVSGTSH